MTEHMPIESDNPFWRFSLHVYGAREVENTCLLLQDEYSLDVNLILLLVWCGFSGVKLTNDSISSLSRHSQAWCDTSVKPLRTLRRALKSDVGAMTPAMAADFRDHVKKLELESEKLQQFMLYDLLMKMPAKNARDGERKAVARQNLILYMHFQKIQITEDLRDSLERLLLACEVRGLSLKI